MTKTKPVRSSLDDVDVQTAGNATSSQTSNKYEIKIDVMKKFRDEYHEIHGAKAFLKIKKHIDSRGGTNIDPHLVRYVTEGSEKFVSSLVGFWQNIGVVSALIGAISVTVTLASPSFMYAFATDDVTIVSSQELHNLATAYYVFWTLAAISEIAAVLVVTIANIHFLLMLNEDDMIWFIIHWNGIVGDLSQIFLVTGCFSCVIGVCCGIYLITDKRTAFICSGVAGGITFTVLSVWLYMLALNKQRSAKSIKEFIHLFQSQTR